MFPPPLFFHCSDNQIQLLQLLFTPRIACFSVDRPQKLTCCFDEQAIFQRSSCLSIRVHFPLCFFYREVVRRHLGPVTPVAFVTKALLPGLLLSQLEPRSYGAKDIGVLWTFGFANISQLARCESNLWLGLVESIKVRAQCILQGSNISARVQSVPRLEAALGLARFEHHHQGVQAMNDLIKWPALERVGRRHVLIVEKVHKLAGIIL